MALAVKGLATPALLESFEIERMPVIADMLKITTDLFKNAFNTDTQEKIQLAKEAEAAAADAGADAEAMVGAGDDPVLEIGRRISKSFETNNGPWEILRACWINELIVS